MTTAQATDLIVRPESIQKLYTDYLSQRFAVNRRYQRKLVWTVEEKRALIDSILRDLPVPLVLVAEISGEQPYVYEIIDGMQRLNAIFAFIENEYDVDGKYFDLEALADTKEMNDDGQLEQKQPVMSRENSRKLANYSLALSVFRATGTAQIDEVFRRINSGGRRLSGQELRQAGSTAEIAQLVRVLASRIRGDSSRGDVVPLSEMPKLSINNKHLDYGVDVDTIFWVQQSILRRLDVRTSNDEQLILDLLVDCLVDPFVSSGTDTRDSAYGLEEDMESASGKLESRIQENLSLRTPEAIQNDFFRIFDELRLVLGEADEKFVRLVVGRSSGGRYPRYFHAVFMAFYELVVQEAMRVRDRPKVVRGLTNIGAPKGPLMIPGGGGDWTVEDKRRNINAVKGAIRDGFEPVPRGEQEDIGRYGLASHLETILANSVTEQSLCELKQGLLDLTEGLRKFDEESWKKILKTISAIANDGRSNTGYLIIGAADDQKASDRVRALDQTEPVKYRGYSIIGVGREARILSLQLKDYYDWVANKLTGCNLEPDLRSQITADMRLVDYHGLAVIVLKVESQEKPAFFEGKIYERRGSSTVVVPHSEYHRIFRKFM